MENGRLISASSVVQALQPLIGLPLSIARSAADMRIFHFGEIRPAADGKGTVGEYALHIQCSWRLVGPGRMIAGSADRYSPPENGEDIDIDDSQNGCLQDERLSALLGGFDTATRSHINATAGLIVLAVRADPYGGAEISLSGDVGLQLFPDSAVAENWRLIKTSELTHFVVEGGSAAIQEATPIDGPEMTPRSRDDALTPQGWIVRVWCGYEESDDPAYDTTLYISGYADPTEAVAAVRRVRGREGEKMEALGDAIFPDAGPQPKPREVRKIGGV